MTDIVWPQVRGLLLTMRPRQWIKNGFIFLPLIFDFKMFQSRPVLNSAIGFLVLCLLSSVVYIVNDSVDAPQDRLHPRKRNRPIAHGDVSVSLAVVWAIVMGILGLTVSFALHTTFGLVAAGYLVLQLLYSFVLKQIVLLDVFTLASGFVLRVAAGIPLVAAERFSPWLFLCTFLISLLIGFGKRRGEIVELGGSTATRAILREYNLPLLDSIISIVTGALVVAYSFYTFTAPQLPVDHSMLLTVPAAMYGLFRYLYLVHVRGEGGAPDELALKDRGLLAATAVFMATAVVVLYVIR